ADWTPASVVAFRLRECETALAHAKLQLGGCAVLVAFAAFVWLAGALELTLAAARRCEPTPASGGRLFHDLERRALRLPAGRRLVRLRRRVRSRRRRLLVGEDHAVAVLARIDSEHRVDRHLDSPRDPGEPRFERHEIVAEHE